ncbi:MAG: hypothetical protein J6M55_06185 [Paludibacteraceae bacterium]|nr:hypothetical protein [Paludibacteraceae bacterium]
MRRIVLSFILMAAAVLPAAAAYELTATKVTVQDLTVDKNNFFVTVEASTSTGEYEIAFDVWPATRSAIGTFSAADKTIGYVSSYVHKTKANGNAVDMWYSCNDDAEISLSIVRKDESTCTLSGSIQATRNGNTYTYDIRAFDFAYTEGAVEPEPEKDPYRFEPAEATNIRFQADVIHFRQREGYIEVTLNEMANETYDWVELRLLSDTMAMPAGTYPIDESRTKGSLTASKGYLGSVKGDDPCYVAIRGSKEDWGQYTPYYLASGSLAVSYNAKGDSIRISGSATSHNGTTVAIDAKSYNMLYVQEETPKEPEHVTLGIDTVAITYLSNESDSANNRFVYVFNFSRSDDYPTVLTDVVMSKPMEIVAGSYSLADGSLKGLQLAQNQEDFNMNLYTGSAYAFTAASLTLTEGANGEWQYTMHMEDEIGSTYDFSFSQTPHITLYPQPAVDPKDAPYTDEQREKAVVTAVLDTIVWDSKTVAKDGVIDIYLTQRHADVNGLRAYLHLGMYSQEAYPEAGIYPVNGSEEAGTFSASLGRYGNVLIPCYAALMDNDGWTHAIWYITGGEISLSYDAQGQPALSGECSTYFGSTIRFSYMPVAQGIENVQRTDVQCTKVIKDGKLYLMYKGQMYDVQGRIVH